MRLRFASCRSRSWDSRHAGSPTCCAGSAWVSPIGLHRAGPHSRAVRHGDRRAAQRLGGVTAVLRVRSRADRDPGRARRGRGSGHHAGDLPPQDRTDSGPADHGAHDCAGRRRRRTRHRRLPRSDGPGGRRCPDRADDRRAIRHCCTSPAAPPARRRAPSTCTARSSRTTSPACYALDLHPDDIFWCTADPGWVTGTSYGIIAPLTARRHVHRRRGRLRRRALVPDPAGPAGHGLVHRADRDPHADEGRRGAVRSATTFPAALHRQRRRAAQPGSGALGQARCSACRSTTTGGRPRPAAS